MTQAKYREYQEAKAIFLLRVWIARVKMCKIIFLKTIFIFALLQLAACANTKEQDTTKEVTANSPTIFVAKYKDFGPPQLSSPLLGNQWWQWPDPENHKPVTYDVKVVVYRDVSLDVVKASFPVIPEKKQDYRYVAYEDAVTYFDNTIEQLLLEMKDSGDAESVAMLSSFPLRLYETVLRMEKIYQWGQSRTPIS